MEVEVDALRFKLYNLLRHLNSAQPVYCWQIHGSAENSLYRALGCSSKQSLENILLACKLARSTVDGNDVRVRFDSQPFNKYLRNTNPVCQLIRYGKSQELYLQFGYGKFHKGLWKETPKLPHRSETGGMVHVFQMDQMVRKAAQTRPNAAAVTLQEGGNLKNGEPARKRNNGDRTSSQNPGLRSPMAGNRPRLTDTPGLANPPRQLNNSEQMTLSEPIRRRLNLDDHVCPLCSQPITEAGVTPLSSKTEYHYECLQDWLLSESGGSSDRERQYHTEQVGANPSVMVPVPNGWTLITTEMSNTLEKSSEKMKELRVLFSKTMEIRDTSS